jgi:hypothetical protein
VHGKGNTTDRGYGSEHQKLRKQWAPIVAAGQATCHSRRCLHHTRTIHPGQRWVLGHTDDRTTWTGPEHQRCGLSDGARRGNQMRGRMRRARRLTPQPAPRW